MCNGTSHTIDWSVGLREGGGKGGGYGMDKQANGTVVSLLMEIDWTHLKSYWTALRGWPFTFHWNK